MPQQYRQQITNTFRDDAIRSVLLIDDEYSTYAELTENQEKILEVFNQECSDDEKCEKILKITSEIHRVHQRTNIAAQFTDFFRKMKCLCDIEKQTDSLNPEKVRKSDLILLDYCLIGDDATKSIQLLKALSISKHLNIVVIYTNKPLKDVWLEVASSLMGVRRLSPVEFFGENTSLLMRWIEIESVIKRCWISVSRNQKVKYLLGEKQLLIDSLKNQLWMDIQKDEEFDESIHTEPDDLFIEYLIKEDISRVNVLGGETIHQDIHGKDELWLQCGEVFIALCEKLDDMEDDEVSHPQAVWDKLEFALHDWYPSFYRVVLSELQNRIEDSNFSMSKILGKSQHEQIALLWSILKSPEKKKMDVSEGLLRHLLLDISDELLHVDKKSAPNFIKTLAQNVAEDIPAYVKYSKAKTMEHNQFLSDALNIAKKNYKTSTDSFNAKFCESVAHAHNSLLSMERARPTYITTGTVLKSCNNSWYVCVTPSCDTVPEQEMDDCSRNLSPHRVLDFIKLQLEELSSALQVATQSSHIFIKNKGERIALRVVNQYTKQPDLIQLIIQNHREGINGDVVNATTLSSIKKKKNRGELTLTKIKLYPIGNLKAAYAARFQAVKSHHEGRIGVDYTPADFSVIDY